jgi:hypothetical protein
MNPIKRLYRAFKYGANSPLTRPETAWLYQANVQTTVHIVPSRPIKNVTPQPICLK